MDDVWMSWKIQFGVRRMTNTSENTMHKSSINPSDFRAKSQTQGFVGAALLTGYEDLDSSDAYEHRGEGGLKG